MRKYGKMMATALAVVLCLALALGILASGNMGGTVGNGGGSGVTEGGVGGDGLYNEGNTVTGDGRADDNLTGGGSMVDHGANGNEANGNSGGTGNAGDGVIDNGDTRENGENNTLGDAAGETTMAQAAEDVTDTVEKSSASAAWFYPKFRHFPPPR